MIPIQPTIAPVTTTESGGKAGLVSNSPESEALSFQEISERLNVLASTHVVPSEGFLQNGKALTKDVVNGQGLLEEESLPENTILGLSEIPVDFNPENSALMSAEGDYQIEGLEEPLVFDEENNSVSEVVDAGYSSTHSPLRAEETRVGITAGTPTETEATKVGLTQKTLATEDSSLDAEVQNTTKAQTLSNESLQQIRNSSFNVETARQNIVANTANPSVAPTPENTESLAQSQTTPLQSAKIFNSPNSALNSLEPEEVTLDNEVLLESEEKLKTPAVHREFAQTMDRVANGRVQIPVNISFGKPEWNAMVADRTALMFAQNISSAELQLDPPELGPLQVKVSVNQDQASVAFTVANSAVRESVDQSILRLRELLSQQGLDLVDVDVSDQQQQQFSENSENHGENAKLLGANTPEEFEEEAPLVQTASVSYGIDSYA